MKIGIFLGSFDPIHIGHLSIISRVLNSGLVDKIQLVPAYHNPWKPLQTNYTTRCLLASIGTEYFKKKVSVEMYESRLAEILQQDHVPSYKTLEYITEMLKNKEVFVITTSETFLEIPHWENGEEVLEKYNFIVINTHRTVTKKQKDLIEEYANYLLETTIIEFSSSKAREMIRQGNKYLYPLIPEAVMKNITKLKLYVKST